MKLEVRCVGRVRMLEVGNVNINIIENKPIKTFTDLRVYQSLYQAMLKVIKEVIPALPKEEKFDLVDQLRRASKSAPSQLAEGYAKKHHLRSWQKYIADAIGECNEMIHHLSVCRDVYGKNVSTETVNNLIEQYNICGKQLYNLGKNWKNRE